jgi:hypothetical protein
MIRVKLSVTERLKILFGWKLHIELWPRNSAQSYHQYSLPPWRQWSYECSKPRG